MDFMRNLSSGLVDIMRGKVGAHASCSGLPDRETQGVLDMLMKFNLKRSSTFNMSEKQATRSFIKSKFAEYGAGVVFTQSFNIRHKSKEEDAEERRTGVCLSLSRFNNSLERKRR